MRTISYFYFFVTLATTSFYSPFSSAHSDEINQATLSIDNSERFQLVLVVDFIHLLKNYLVISGDDTQVINTLNQLSFSQQKKILEDVREVLSKQTNIQFNPINTNARSKAHGDGGIDGHEENKVSQTAEQSSKNEKSLYRVDSPFIGLGLQQLKRILSSQVSLSGHQAQLHASGTIPSGTSNLAVRFSPLLGDIILKVVRPQQEIISTAKLSNNYKVNLESVNHPTGSAFMPSTISNILDYTYQGFVHILPRGLDHILFVLALLLFAKSRATLLWQVSAFTLAHTITLALGIYGIVEVSGSIVEPLIALSIVYVALENIYRAKSKSIGHARIPVIFAFGLLHGLGFASVLSDVGLPQGQYALSLISFNIGVELGQLTVIALAFVCLLGFRNKIWYQKKLVLNLNIAIAIVASYWLIERLL